MMIYNFRDYFLKCVVSTSLNLLHHSFWRKPAILITRILRSPMERSMWPKTEASWAILKMDSRPSRAFKWPEPTSWHLGLQLQERSWDKTTQLNYTNYWPAELQDNKCSFFKTLHVGVITYTAIDITHTAKIWACRTGSNNQSSKQTWVTEELKSFNKQKAVLYEQLG